MKIKVKVKTLLAIFTVFALLVVWGVPTITMGIARYLDSKGSDKASLFYEKYANNKFANNIEGKYLYASSLVKSFDKYFIYNTGWGGGENNSLEDIKSVKEILMDNLNHNPKTKTDQDYFVKSYNLLIETLIATGEVDELRAWIQFGKGSSLEELNYYGDIYESFLFYANRDYNKAQEIMDKYKLTKGDDYLFNILQGEILFMQEKYDEALLYLDRVHDTHFSMRRDSAFGSTGYINRGWWIKDEFQEMGYGDNKVKGRVTYDGKPLAFVEIFINPAHGGFRSGGESYFAITDENGEFETVGLKNGSYDVGIGIEGALLTDKVMERSEYNYLDLSGNGGELNFKFNNTMKITNPKPGEVISGDTFMVSWEEVEGADYYRVEPVIFSQPFEKSGSSFRSAIADINGDLNIEGTQAHFDINKLSNLISGISYDGDDYIISANAILGIFLPEIDYPIVVNAYNEEGILITSSLALRTYYDQIASVRFGGELSEGEKLILDQEYPQAIEYFENVLNEDPSNLKALNYMAKIYGLGWKKGEKDLEKALNLANRYSELRNDSQLIFEIARLFSLEEIKEYREVFKEILDDNQDNNEINYYYARYYLAIEDWESARDAFSKYESYTPEQLFLLNMYFTDYDKAIENLLSDGYYLSRLKSSRVIEALNNLSDKKPLTPDLQVFNDFLLRLVTGSIDYKEGYETYQATNRQISDQNLKTILYEIYLDRHWDTRY